MSETTTNHQEGDNEPMMICVDRIDRTDDILDDVLGGDSRAIYATAEKLWENGKVLTYCYVEGLYSGNDRQHKKVDETILEWEEYANVTFKKVDGPDALIRISFYTYGGSWSAVGKDALDTVYFKPGEATMNFGWVAANTDTMKPYERGTILHEFGHALGLLHEHQSPARGGVITIDEEAAYKHFAKDGWSRQTTKANFIDVYNKSQISNYTRLDTTSIMMYFMDAKLNKQHIEIPPNVALSELDKAFAGIHYPRATPHPKAPTWTFQHAVDCAGFASDVKQKVLDAYKEDPTGVKVRKNLQEWIDQSRH